MKVQISYVYSVLYFEVINIQLKLSNVFVCLFYYLYLKISDFTTKELTK